MVSYNDILQNQISGLGLWQLRTYVLFIFSSPFLLIYFPVFPGFRTHHLCRPEGYGSNNWTLAQWRNLTAPDLEQPPSKGQSFDGCRTFPVPPDVDFNASFEEALLIVRASNVTAQPCSSGWLYFRDSTAYRGTLIAGFDLVCGRSSLLSWSTSVFMLGFIAGAAIFGEVGDRVGRKPAAVSSLLLGIGATLLTSFAPSVIVFMVGRFLVGACTQGHYVVTYTLIMEISGPKGRDIFTTFGSFYISVLSLSWYTFLAYFIQDWRWLHLACSACMIIVLFYFPFMPESPRWLLSKGRYEEALKEIRKAIRLNHPDQDISLELDDLRPIAAAANGDVEATAEAVPGVCDLFRTPVLRKISLLLMCAWFSHSLSYYGASFYSVKLPGVSPYLAFTIPSVLKIGFLAAQLVMARFLPRKPCFVCFQIIGSLCCIAVALVHLVPGIEPQTKNIIGMAFMSLFLGFVVSGFALVYVYTSELFPTSLRTRGFGVCSVASRIGATLSPLVVDLDRTAGIRSLPMAICATVFLTTGLTSLMLPESKDRPLPETPAQLELMYQRKKSEVEEEEKEEVEA